MCSTRSLSRYPVLGFGRDKREDRERETNRWVINNVGWLFRSISACFLYVGTLFFFFFFREILNFQRDCWGNGIFVVDRFEFQYW